MPRGGRRARTAHWDRRGRRRQVVEDLEHRLHHVTSFVAIPLFVLANAGVYLGGGKLGGRSGRTDDHRRARARKLAAIAGATSCSGLKRGGLDGIGFTVSLFIAGLADDPVELQEQKGRRLRRHAGRGLLGAAML